MRILPSSFTFASMSPIRRPLQDGHHIPLFRHPHIYQHLGQGKHHFGQLGKALALALHHRQHLQGGQYSVTGGIVVEEDHVARLLATQVISPFCISSTT